MKKLLKTIVIIAAMFGILMTIVCLCSHNMHGANIAKYALIAAGTVGAYYALHKCAVQMSECMDTKERRSDGTPCHRIGPMWMFLAFFIMECLMTAACVYLLINMWVPRDLLNFTMSIVISGLICFMLTHRWKK